MVVHKTITDYKESLSFAEGIDRLANENPKGKIVRLGAIPPDCNNSGAWDGSDDCQDIQSDIANAIGRLDGMPWYLVGNNRSVKFLSCPSRYNTTGYPAWVMVGMCLMHQLGDPSFLVFNNFVKDDVVYLLNKEITSAVMIDIGGLN